MRNTLKLLLLSKPPNVPSPSPTSFILDTLSAAAAYSLRLLRTAYTGFCVRVRRSSDNTEQNIGFVGGVIDTAALLAFVGANNGFVVTWYDQSVNALNATQGTAANQPRIVNAGVLEIRNAKATSIYTPNQRLQTPAAFSHPAQFSACAVAFAASPSDSGIFQIGSTNDFGSLFTEASSWLGRGNGGIGAATIAHSNALLTQLSFLCQSLSQVIRRQGVLGTSEARGFSSATNAVLTIGELNGFYFLNGGISELVLFSSILSTADRELLETNQMSYHGI